MRFSSAETIAAAAAIENSKQPHNEYVFWLKQPSQELFGFSFP